MQSKNSEVCIPKSNNLRTLSHQRRLRTYERHAFFLRKQKSGRSIESFVKDLKNLSCTCEFKGPKESLIKDLFIVGLLEANHHIKERLLHEDNGKKFDEIFDLAWTIEMSRTNDTPSSSQEIEFMKIKKTDKFVHKKT